MNRFRLLSFVRFSRFAVIALMALGSIYMFSINGFAAPKVIKFAHSENQIDLIQSPYLAYTSVFKRIVESETNHKYEIEVFPNKQLGDLRSMAEQVSRGIIEISGGQNSGLMSSFDPNMQVSELPYAFPNTEIGRIVFNGWFGKQLADEVAAKSNIRML